MARIGGISIRILALVPALGLLAGCQPTDGNASAGADAATPSSAGADVKAGPGATSAEGVPAGDASDLGGTELDEATRSLVQGSVAIAASAVACDMGTKSQADRGIADQRASYVGRGISGSAYDRVVNEAWQKTTDKFAAATPAEKSQACASMAAFGSQLEQMAKDVEGMQGKEN